MGDDRRHALHTQPIECALCGLERIFFGEDNAGNIKQAKINAFVSAAKSDWYVDYMPTGHLCPECRRLPGTEAMQY